MTIDGVLTRVAAGRPLSAPEALTLADSTDPQPLMRIAAALRSISTIPRISPCSSGSHR